MTTEEIIERLLEEKHITVREAMTIMKDVTQESVRRMFYSRTFDPFYSAFGSDIIANDKIVDNSSLTYNCNKLCN